METAALTTGPATVGRLRASVRSDGHTTGSTPSLARARLDGYQQRRPLAADASLTPLRASGGKGSRGYRVGAAQ